jgi:pSer/pThr/pTyr-binding forkhead associated (FHA) protein
MGGTAPFPGERPTEAAPGQPRLEVLGSGQTVALPDKDEILIGREDPLSEPPIFPDVDLTPFGGEEGGVSRRHARIVRRGSDYLLEDLQSTNYTKLNGQRIAARTPTALADGSRVDFGRVAMVFRR